MLRGVASFSFFCTVAVGCTSLLGDFAVSGGPIDAGSPTDAAGVPVDAGLAWAIVQASTSDVSVFVGQAAVVDASNSSTTQGTLTFSWAVVLAPAGSGVTTSNLAGATSAKATFVPDLNGEYDLQVTVTALGVSDTRTAKVSAASPQVLFAQGIAPGADKGSATYVVTDSDGGSHAVLCPDVISNSSVPIGAFAAYTGRAYDFWEAPPGQPLKFAAFTLDAIPDAGLFAHLWSGTSASTCDAGPIDYATTSFGPGRPWGSDPHFSPDGSRFVVFDRDWNIVTFAADAADGGGETSHVVATYPVPYKQAPAYFDPVAAGPDAGYPFEPPRVAWTDNGLAWAQPTSSGWEIVEAADMQDATPTRYMTCKGVTPREIAMLRDGTVIVSYRPTLDSSENIHLLKPDAQQNCYHEQQYTNLLDSGTSVATDFAVSPDETQIAFLEMDTTSQDASLWTTPGGGSTLPGGYVYVVPVAGGTPVLVSSDPAIYGPRWIGGGSALVFTRLDGVAPTTGRPATSVVVIGLDGGPARIVAQGDGVTSFAATSGNAACGVSPSGARGATGARWSAGVWVLVAGARWARRRRRLRTGSSRSATDLSV